MTYNGFADASNRLRSKRAEIENKFNELQTEKYMRYQQLLQERNKLHKLMNKMPTIRVLESMKNRQTKLEILKPLTSESRKRAISNSFATPTASTGAKEARISILNYRNLEDLNRAFFSHK